MKSSAEDSRRQASSILMISAEASSGLYAERLLQELKTRQPHVHCFGVGTPEMEALGFERLGRSEEMAVVGIVEILAHYKDLRKVFYNLVEQAKQRRPALVVLMDYPEFNLMFAKEMKKLGIPCVYYISPQVWAWRQGRVHKIKKYCDQVLLLFPFEVEFYKQFDVPFQFVGHPLLDELPKDYQDRKKSLLHRRQCGFSDQDIVIGLMPGSRRSELKYNFPTQLEVARQLLLKFPENVKIAVLVAPSFQKEQIQDYLQDLRFPIMVLKDDPFRMLDLVDYILAASGTATLMVGLMEKPMVIMYKAQALTVFIGRRIIKGYFGIVNLILGKQAVPERLQEQANVTELTNLMAKYIQDPEYTQKVREDLAQLQNLLGTRGATSRVVNIIESYLPARS